MSPNRANYAGVIARDCRIVADSRHDGGKWRVLYEGREVTSARLIYDACQWVAQLRRLNDK